MLPEGVSIRKYFPPGEQAAVTPAIQEVSDKFVNRSYPAGFKDVHNYLFSRIQIVPYTEDIVGVEKTRRWKLTADDLLRVRTVIDTKYCNDMVNLFLAVTKGMGFDARLAKVFAGDSQSEEINVHSLALIDSPNFESLYVVNAGSRDNYWIEPFSRDMEMSLGNRLPRNWILWKADVDQWSMGLNDSSQEQTTIIADARELLSSLK